MPRHMPVEGHKGIYVSDTKDRGQVYEVRYRDSDFRDRFVVAGPNLEDALLRQAEIRVKLAKAIRVAPCHLTVADVVQEWREIRMGADSTLAPSSIRKYATVINRRIIPDLGHLKVQEVTPDTVFKWLSKMEPLDKRKSKGDKLAPATRSAAYMVLHDILGYAANARRGYIPINPCASLEKGERPRVEKLGIRVLSNKEADLLLEATSDLVRPLVHTALLTGMRLGELLGLSWDDIDFTEKVIHVRGQDYNGTYLPTKGKEHRDIPLFPSCQRVLFDLPSRFQGQRVFLGADGKPLSRPAVGRNFRQARKVLSSEPRPIRLHDCRHTFASALLRDGRDVTWVSQLLGHQNTQTTLEVYAHVINREDRMEQATERLAEALGEWAR